MPKIAFLECSRCAYRASTDIAQTACPVDAGLLYVRYDMEALRRTARRENIAARAAASPASLGMWRYADVLPDVAPVSLGEGWTPMLACRRHANLFVKDEGANPAGCFDARGFALAIAMAKHDGLKQVAAATSSNAAGSLAAYAAAAGLEAHLFMPEDVPLANHLECVLYRAHVHLVGGSIGDGARRVGDAIQGQRDAGLSREQIWFDVSTRTKPFRLEGAKTVGYEVVEQLGWQYPGALLCADGVALIAMWKAFDEMEQLGWVSGKRPRLYAVQDATDTVTSTSVSGPQVDTMVLEIVQQSGGSVVSSTKDEIIAAIRDWAENEGLFLSPEGAAAAGAYDKLLAAGDIEQHERVVLINTSSGLRYADKIAQAIHLRHPHLLPTSLPVGGIISPV